MYCVCSDPETWAVDKKVEGLSVWMYYRLIRHCTYKNASTKLGRSETVVRTAMKRSSKTFTIHTKMQWNALKK